MTSAVEHWKDHVRSLRPVHRHKPQNSDVTSLVSRQLGLEIQRRHDLADEIECVLSTSTTFSEVHDRLTRALRRHRG